MKIQGSVFTLLLLFFSTSGEAIAYKRDRLLLPTSTTSNQAQIAQLPTASPIKAPKTDYDHESSQYITKLLYRNLSSFSKLMSSTGANGGNVAWENKKTSKWYIEQQQYGEGLIIGGLIKNGDERAIQAGFKMFDWGFAQQSADGGFAGTGDPFHSTAFFVQAVAHSLLVIQQSPQASKYADKVTYYKPMLQRAARWMISPEVWKKGTKNDQPYTHRRYLNAVALGLTGKLTGDQELIDYARKLITDGLSLQRSDGVNPEKGGHDSSYQMVSVMFAQRWATYFADDSLTPQVITMIKTSMAWEEKRILSTGEIDSKGNTRSAGQEFGRTGKVKTMDYKAAIRGFAYWAAVTNDQKWAAIAQKISQFYY